MLGGDSPAPPPVASALPPDAAATTRTAASTVTITVSRRATRRMRRWDGAAPRHQPYRRRYRHRQLLPVGLFVMASVVSVVVDLLYRHGPDEENPAVFFFGLPLVRAETAVAASSASTSKTTTTAERQDEQHNSKNKNGNSAPSTAHQDDTPPPLPEGNVAASSEASQSPDPTEAEPLMSDFSSSPSNERRLDPVELYLYWHDELPRRVHGWLRVLGSNLAHIARHQPPVGIVSLLLTLRVGNRIWNSIQQALVELEGGDAAAATNGAGISSDSQRSVGASSSSSVASAKHSHSRRRYRRNRWGSTAWSLDRGDDMYPTHGGVQPNRVLLCMTVLQQRQQQQQQPLATAAPDDLPSPGSKSGSSNDPILDGEAKRWLVEAMSVNAQAVDVSAAATSSPLLDFCRQLAVPLSRVSELSLMNGTSTSSSTSRRTSQDMTATTTSVEELSYWTCQVRMHDALLRVVRDRLLQSTVRLARTSRHWKRRRRVMSTAMALTGAAADSTSTSNGFGVLNWWNRHVVQRRRKWVLEMDHDQKSRWAVAQASYVAEATKLGRVASVLIQQPDDLDSSHLIVATRAEPAPDKTAPADDSAAVTSDDTRHDSGSRPLPRRGPGQWLPQYSMRWVADGKGHVSIRKLDPNPMAWWEAPQSTYNQRHGDHLHGDQFSRTVQGQVDAVRQAQAWVHEARHVIAQVVQETIETSVPDPNKNYERDDFLNNSTERQQTFDAWCTAPRPSAGSIDKQEHEPDHDLQVWNRVLAYCDALSTWRRPGEGRAVRWWDLAVVGWTRRLDFLGIPTSFLYYRLAQLVHTKIHPYLPSLREDLSELIQTLWSIVQQRVLFPVRQIVLDILNQNKGMMSAFSLDEEQLSLDRMLRDLNLADGSPEQRRLGLQRATEQYEQILQRGLLSNLVRGRLVRLMLIQVQQLKVGLLSALDTIDVLMQGNRIHFYALATIPSILIAYYSFRFFLRFLYSVRAKDPRPVSSAHADMTSYLDAMEGIFLMSDGAASQQPQLARSRHLRLSPLEVGELVLHVHRYLLLLDFGSPPFSIPDCLYIHENLRELFHHPGLFVHGGGFGGGGQADVSVDVIHDSHLLSFLGTIRRKHQNLLESSY